MGIMIFGQPRSNWAQAATPPTIFSSGSQPSLGSTGKIATCFWKRLGQMCHFQIHLKFGTVGMGAGTGNYGVDFTIPKWDGSAGQESFDPNWLIDNFMVSSYPYNYLGGSFNDVSANGWMALKLAMSNAEPTSIYAITESASSANVSQGSAWSATAPVAPAAGDEISIWGAIPIIGWRET